MSSLLGALKAAAEPTRLRLLALLARAELTVTELTQVLGQSQPRLSRHLKMMVEGGLIDRFREGSWVFHRLASDGPGGALAADIIALLDTDAADLRRDSARLDQVIRARAEAAAAYFSANAADWDRIRAYDVPAAEVEAALQSAVGDDPINSLLDIGTGTGRMLELFAPQARNALGVDLNPDMLRLARARLEAAGLGHVQVRQGDMYALALPAASVDLVLFHQVLHYAAEPQAALAEAARVLAPAGRVAIVDFLPHQLEVLRDSHAHRRLGFSPQEVAHWGAGAGLDLDLVATLEGEPLVVGLWLGGSRTPDTSSGKPSAPKAPS